MIKIEIPADNTRLAAAIGKALTEYAEAPATRRKDDFGELTDTSRNVDQATKDIYEAETERDDGQNNEGDLVDNSSASAAQDSRVDTKGVPFNGAFCGVAKIPFYATGKNKGQWKRKGGVPEDDYSAWYASQLACVLVEESVEIDEGIDTAAAFGQQTTAATTDKPAPKDCGEFMGWVSQQQAAGRLNQHDIADAYEKLHIGVTDLFPPNTPESVAGHVKNLFAVLGGLE